MQCLEILIKKKKNTNVYQTPIHLESQKKFKNILFLFLPLCLPKPVREKEENIKKKKRKPLQLFLLSVGWIVGIWPQDHSL